VWIVSEVSHLKFGDISERRLDILIHFQHIDFQTYPMRYITLPTSLSRNMLFNHFTNTHHSPCHSSMQFTQPKQPKPLQPPTPPTNLLPTTPPTTASHPRARHSPSSSPRSPDPRHSATEAGYTLSRRTGHLVHWGSLRWLPCSLRWGSRLGDRI
jgi:hypothetical protein